LPVIHKVAILNTIEARDDCPTIRTPVPAALLSEYEQYFTTTDAK